MSVRPYPLCPRQPTLFTAHKLSQQFPKQPKFKMSSLKQVIYNALFKCATPEHGVVPSEFETAEAARDHFIALVMTELFPEHGNESVVEVPVVETPVQTLPERVAERKATKEEKEAAKAAKLAEKEAAKAAKEAEKAAAAKAKEEAKAAKEAEKAAKAEAKAAKAATPKKSPEEKAAEKEAEKAAKLAEKEAEKAAKLAEKEAEKARKAAEKEAAKKSPEQKAAEKEAEKARKAAEKEAAKAAEKLAKEQAKEAEKAAKLAEKEAEKKAKEEAKAAEKAAKEAEKAAAKAAKSPVKPADVPLPASPKPKKAKPASDANVPKMDPTWRKTLKEADKDRAKELEPELLTYLNAMSKDEFNGKTAREHVAAFMAARTKPTSDATSQVAPVDLEVVEFQGKEYYVNPETKRVYEGVVDAEGNLTVTKPVGYVGMADFKDMTLEED